MGNTTTKFRKALINGDENLACQIYENNPQLKESLDPNTSYGEPYQHNTPLHYAARHGMNRILGTFLFGRDGNPNKRNVHNETSMHLLCPLGELTPSSLRSDLLCLFSLIFG